MFSDLRVGQGFDVHPLVEGRKLIIGGVKIPYKLGLYGHSDADVLLHSIADAVSGAVGREDIGTFFPDSDQAWKDLNSSYLLERVWEDISNLGWQLCNLDSTIIAEAPLMAPFIPQMKSKIATLLEVRESQIGIKATTAEKLGSLGRGEGIAVMSVALLRLSKRFTDSGD